MSINEEPRIYPEPLIDGTLEVLLGALYAGMDFTDEAKHILDQIAGHEDTIIETLDHEKGSDRLDAAYHRLGQIAAIDALLERPEPRKVGF